MPKAVVRGIVVLLVSAGSCTSTSGGPPSSVAEGLGVATPQYILRQLTLPPGPQSARALHQLEGLRSCQARWTYARYLLDLFDVAEALSGEQDEVSEHQRRIARRSQDLLQEALYIAQPDVAQEALTRTRLRSTMVALPHRCPQEVLARQAVALLDADELPRDDPATALAVAVSYKRVRLSASELAPNAHLRLVEWCERSFREAVRSPPWEQQAHLDRCLFPLFEADPGPYFDADPARRPPDPPWTAIRGELERQLEVLATTRFAAVANSQRRYDASYFLRVGADLPAALALRELDLPASDQGQPLDRVPLVRITERDFVVDSLVVQQGDRGALERALARRLRGDRRGAIAVVCRLRTLLYPLFELGRAARKQGVRRLYLGVVRRVATSAPAGDVQRAIAGPGPVWRLEGIPVSLRLLTRDRQRDVSRDRARQLDYDPRAAEAQLSLTVHATALQLSSRDGRLAPVPPSALATHLIPLLRLLRAAYPAEQSLIIAPTRRTTYRQLLAIVQAVRLDGRTPLFPAVALASSAAITPPSRRIDQFIHDLARRHRHATPRAK